MDRDIEQAADAATRPDPAAVEQAIEAARRANGVYSCHRCDHSAKTVLAAAPVIAAATAEQIAAAIEFEATTASMLRAARIARSFAAGLPGGDSDGS